MGLAISGFDPVLKLLPRVNFINILQAAFTHEDSKNAKKTVKLSVFFTLLGSARTKAARRMLMKLTPGWVKENGNARAYMSQNKCRKEMKHV